MLYIKNKNLFGPSFYKGKLTNHSSLWQNQEKCSKTNVTAEKPEYCYKYMRNESSPTRNMNRKDIDT